MASVDSVRAGSVNGLRLDRGGWASPELFAGLTDSLGIFGSGIVSVASYHKYVLGNEANLSSFAGLSLLASVLYVALAKSRGNYDPYIFFNAAASARRSLFIWAMVVALLSLTAFLLKTGDYFSRGSSIIFAVSGGVTLLGSHALWRRAAQWAGRHGAIFSPRSVLLRLNGTAPAALRASPSTSSLSLIDQNVVEQHWLSMRDGAQVHQTLERIAAQVALHRIDEVLLEVDRTNLTELDAILDRLRILPIPVRLLVDPLTQRLITRPTSMVEGRVLCEVQRAPLSFGERLLKRCLDMTVATLALVVFSPVMLVTALLIKWDSKGPVFFLQNRRGFSGQMFRIIKFRSMTVMDNGDTIVQAKTGDVRVTRVGRFIRRTSIDELPQLWNVLKGDMSIVGPRPHAVAHDDYYSRLIADYAMRHHTKPGLTGLAQVKGFRGETPQVQDMRDRVELDIKYIDSWSFWRDVSIIAKTALVLFNQTRAV